MDIWSKEANFTWDVYADVNGEWGSFPESGELNMALKSVTFHLLEKLYCDR